MRGRTLVLSAALAFVTLMTLTGSAWAGAAAPTSSLRIETTDKGLHKVTAAQIAGGLGRSESIVRALLAIGRVAVTNQGRPIAWAATPDRSALLFWAEALDSQYATANVYSLTLAKGTRMSSAAPARASGWPGRRSPRRSPSSVTSWPPPPCSPIRPPTTGAGTS